jgi:hypothetical protein
MALGPPEVPQAVDRDRPQPAPEGTGSLAALKLGDLPHHDRKYFLDQIVCVLVEQGLPVQPAANQRRVQVH